MNLEVSAERQLGDLGGTHRVALVQDRPALHRGGVGSAKVGDGSLMVALDHGKQLIRRQRTQLFTGGVTSLDGFEQLNVGNLS